MSNQDPKHGHHVLTMHAVRQLFEAIPGDRHLGYGPQELFEKLDKAQSHADRTPLGYLGYLGFWNPGFDQPPHDKASAGWGDTWKESDDAPDAQAHHAMGNPNLSAQANLTAIENFIVSELMLARMAHEVGSTDVELRHLGAALHALQDSYSGAHLFRDPTHPEDPTAAIQGINNFAWSGILDTHDETLDQVPTVAADDSLARPGSQAAAAAGRELLVSYVNNVDSGRAADFMASIEATISPFFQGPEAKMLSYLSIEYMRQRHDAYSNEVSLDAAPTVTPLPNQSHDHSGDVSEPDDPSNQQSAAAGTFSPVDSTNVSGDSSLSSREGELPHDSGTLECAPDLAPETAWSPSASEAIDQLGDTVGAQAAQLPETLTFTPLDPMDVAAPPSGSVDLPFVDTALLCGPEEAGMAFLGDAGLLASLPSLLDSSLLQDDSLSALASQAHAFVDLGSSAHLGADAHHALDAGPASAGVEHHDVASGASTAGDASYDGSQLQSMDPIQAHDVASHYGFDGGANTDWTIQDNTLPPGGGVEYP